jgi:hypothetical protein
MVGRCARLFSELNSRSANVRKSRFAASLEKTAAKYCFDVSLLSNVLAFRYHGSVYCDDIVITRRRDSFARFSAMAVRKFEPIINPKADASCRPCGGKTNVETGYSWRVHRAPHSALGIA